MSFSPCRCAAADLRKICIHPLDGAAEFFIASDEAAYTHRIVGQSGIEHRDRALRLFLADHTDDVYDYNMRTARTNAAETRSGAGQFRSRAITPPNFCSRTARDGAQMPVSLVYRKGFARNGAAPLLQYGYGAYGLSMDPAFRRRGLSLLDRGFVYAIAHVRGGQEMGRAWYDEGGSCTRKIRSTILSTSRARWSRAATRAKDKVFAMGGSAGGLLMGAVANMSAAGLPRHRGAGAVRGRGHHHAG